MVYYYCKNCNRYIDKPMYDAFLSDISYTPLCPDCFIDFNMIPKQYVDNAGFIRNKKCYWNVDEELTRAVQRQEDQKNKITQLATIAYEKFLKQFNIRSRSDLRFHYSEQDSLCGWHCSICPIDITEQDMVITLSALLKLLGEFDTKLGYSEEEKVAILKTQNNLIPKEEIWETVRWITELYD
jgi:hypothetical protein